MRAKDNGTPIVVEAQAMDGEVSAEFVAIFRQA